MRRKRKQQPSTDESWLLPYADMLTLVLALFIVLYASSEIDQQKFFELRDVFVEELSSGGSQGILDGDADVGKTQTDGDLIKSDEQDEEEETERELNDEEAEEYFSEIQYKEFLEIQEETNAYIAKANLEDQLNTQLTDEGLMLTIVNDILFDSGSAELKEESHDTAREISRILHTDPPHQIVISGHADDIPIGNNIYESNWELSVGRAINFMKLILENTDLNPTLFSAKGFGEHNPLFPNDSPENRAKNRRVEVLILPNLDLGENVEE